MVEIEASSIDNYPQVDTEAKPGCPVDQCGDQQVQLAQTQNPTNCEDQADDNLVVCEDSDADVVDKDVVLTAMTKKQDK